MVNTSFRKFYRLIDSLSQKKKRMEYCLKIKMTKLSLIEEDSTDKSHCPKSCRSGATTGNQYRVATRLVRETHNEEETNPTRRTRRVFLLKKTSSRLCKEMELHIATALTHTSASMSAHDTNRNSLIQTSNRENDQCIHDST